MSVAGRTHQLWVTHPSDAEGDSPGTGSAQAAYGNGIVGTPAIQGHVLQRSPGAGAATVARGILSASGLLTAERGSPGQDWRPSQTFRQS